MARRAKKSKKRESWPKTEVELAEVIAGWMAAQGWTLYFEVTLRSGGMRADIVAERGGALWVVEVKRSAGFAVFDQAIAWKPYAHMVSVGVPWASRRHRSMDVLARASGVGVLCAQEPARRSPETFYVVESVAPQMAQFPTIDRLSSALTEEHRHFARPGNASSSFWSPFKETCEALRIYLRLRGGSAAVAEAVAAIEHHYASAPSARGSLTKWVGRGRVAGVALDGGSFRLT